MADERWLHAAILDDTVVADLLLRLKDSSPSPSSSPPSLFLNSLLPTWGLRQRRSKASSSLLTSSPDKMRENRYSPTTPLSWTGGGSGGGGSPSEGECHESIDRFISKVSAASDTPTTSSKRCKRKKTFAQLKEEESSLMKERTYLEKELATLYVTLKEEKSINENLKRIKLNLQVESGLKSEASVPEERNSLLNGTSEAASSSGPREVKMEDASEHCWPAKKVASSQEPVFVLPDLNMAPDEECSVVGLS